MILDYPPINIYNILWWVCLRIILLLFGALSIFYLLSNEEMRKFISSNFIYFLLFFFVFLATVFLQTWFNGMVYIYHISIVDKTISFKWQDRTSFKEIVSPLQSVTVNLVPSGKNTPYLEIVISEAGDKIVLKQTYFPKWTKEVMDKVIKDVKAAQLLI